MFEEYTRRQYRNRQPDLNPFGEQETATNFNELDIFTRVGHSDTE